MLIGQYKSKLTDKDRLALPKKLRNSLGEEMVIARWYENCLVLVSGNGWEDLLGRLSGTAGPITEPVRDIDRFIYGMAFEVKLDKQGRFIVPELLKEYAGIKSEVVFIGLGDRVEIWSASEWKVKESKVQEKASEAIEKIAKEGKK